MRYELPIPFHASIRRVILDSPNAPPLPVEPAPAAASPVSAEEARRQQAEAEAERMRQEERAAIERTLQAMREAVRGLASEREQRRSEMQRVTIELAVTIAARLIHERIEAGQFALESLVRQTVERLAPDQPVTVRLHAADVALLQKRLGDEPLMPERGELSLIPDPSLQRGTARAEAGAVSVLSQWHEQLEEIRQHLLRSVGHARSEP